MEAPKIIKPIPTQLMNELASYGPFDLTAFIQTPDGSPMRFQAGLENASLPRGLICSGNGMLTGIPAKNTRGQYQVIVVAENEAGSVSANFGLQINPGIAKETLSSFDSLKSEVWHALENNLPIPDLMEAYGRPITVMEVYYLLERWSAIKIWDVFNLDSPGEKVPLKLEGASEHYDVYDRGSCIVAAPKDLFSDERTLEDGLKTARALAGEAYKRRWSVELVGFEKFTRAAWIELQRLEQQHGYGVDIINYQVSSKDVKLHYDLNVVNNPINRPEME
jgi:hypothetical protein